MASPKLDQYSEDLTSLIFETTQRDVASIYVICLQESPNEKQELLTRLQAAIGPRHVLFSYGIHGSLTLAIFVARELIWYTSVPQCMGITTRAAVQTKGAVAICFILFGTSLLFLCSHFAAHEDCVNSRIHDYRRIVDGLDLPKVGLSKGYRESGKTSLDRFDAIFWAGDFNFRVKRPRKIVDNLLQSKGNIFEELLAADELTEVQSQGRAFAQFCEGRIKFPPTYKFDLNSQTYDSSEKQRVPSYTDRILFTAKRNGDINCLAYDCVSSIQTSDHRPVYGSFLVSLRPGIDSIALAAGAFHRDIYIAGNQRRALRFDVIRATRETPRTRVCSLQ
ncbi:unnamed protein product [Calicophoron daubneyi]|uniref:Inositol polyphosphate-related phosphatase domain-containing protein n=1 Tax=Calicophoron daubneyi TaxID=300641 RepID=A0AAV2TC66_CALDB